MFRLAQPEGSITCSGYDNRAIYPYRRWSDSVVEHQVKGKWTVL